MSEANFNVPFSIVHLFLCSWVLEFLRSFLSNLQSTIYNQTAAPVFRTLSGEDGFLFLSPVFCLLFSASRLKVGQNLAKWAFVWVFSGANRYLFGHYLARLGAVFLPKSRIISPKMQFQRNFQHIHQLFSELRLKC
ncbi:MAG: hypothetical protein LLF76_14705 [Planctomycetaceae bacterium]|nr:hypothetical protein [Planctomycetaceae bacterium]